MDLISALAVGAGALVVGGIALAIEALEEDNRQKQSELDFARIQFEKENRERETELKRLAKLNDAHTVLQEYKRMLDTESECERNAYANWKLAKLHMKKLKDQEQSVKCARKKLKGELDAYIRKKTRVFMVFTKRMNLDKDENVCEARRRLRKLREFQESVGASIRSYAQVKKEVWDAMQIRNKQKQKVLKQWQEAKKSKRFFECVSCGKKFAVTVGQLADFQERGFQPPKRCSNCRDQRKLGMRV